MSDDIEAAFGDEAAGDGGDDPDDGAADDGGRGSPDGDGGDGGDGDLRRYLNYAAVGVLALLALVATLRFYFAASATIDTWVAREYRSLFQAAFNLAVLLAAVGGLALQLRRLDR